MIQKLMKQCKMSGGNGVVERAQPHAKKNLAVWGLPGPDWITMKRVKEHLDPRGLFSPGRFVGGI
jgi:glycolate oxidase FAD binding subunit